ncbi:hypothetical protein [Paenisporosarcina sp. OV554]|uniref:hypothetical protein n=1 Tax=Paenisporosarcina sp. OV554 TaxID=2135694 RepID=UPI000D351544|nr:hypothetical protein [Paenisporosarcina sp. OV554]PUB15801.1 hypothetical protein C8K15_10312 [Paenisporosarcina sp. OV554]
MDDKEFEQRMNLLKKSYNRVPSKFKADEVLSKIEDESQQQQYGTVDKSVNTSKWQKNSVWAVSLASIFLIGILSASFMNDHDEEKNSTAAEYDQKEMEELKKDYQSEREKRQKMLGLTNEQFDHLGFVKFADSEFARITHPDTIKKSTLPLKIAYGETIKYLLLPSEMVTSLKNNSPLNEEMSTGFVDELSSKMDDLKMVYDLVITKNKEILNTAKMNGKLDADYLYSRRKDLPEPVQLMISNASQEGIRIEVAPNQKEFIADIEMNDMIFGLDGKIAQSALNSLYIKQMAPFTYGGELVYDTQESAYILESIEYSLMSVRQRGELYSVIKSYYEDLAYTLIFGSSNTAVFSNGKIKEEYQTAWNYFLLIPSVSPMKYYLKPVVDSLSANNWEVNETYKLLDFNDLKDAVRLAETGELAKLMPTEELADSVKVVEWPNSELHQKIHGYLKNPGSKNPDYALSNLTPIESVLLFSYAQQSDFPEVLLDLTLPFQGMESVADIQAFLGNENILPEEVITLMYDERMSTSQNEELFGMIEVQTKETVKTIPVVKNREGVWQIDLGISVTTLGEHYYEPITLKYTKRVQRIYEEFKEAYDFDIIRSESPDIIAGIYLEALYSGDAETQYALLLDDVNYLRPTREEFIGEYSRSADVMDWKTLFESVEYQLEEVQGDHDQVIYFNLKTEYQTKDEIQKGFQLRKTSEGWRVHFMPMQ